MRDRLDGVAVFVETVEAGGFAKAAQRLALSRSAVGKTIARLEARLGVRLFHRTTRIQTLTEDGQVYYERCLRALEELRTGETLLESGRREVAGRLRVSMSVLFGRHCVAPILVEMARQHPKLELDLSFSDRPVDLVAEGFDLAIRSGSLGPGNGLMARRLATYRKVVCAAPAYLAIRGRPRVLAALGDHDTLLYVRGDATHPWLLPAGDSGATDVTPTSRFRFDDLEVIADASVAGMGIAYLPFWLIRERIRSGSLVTLFDDLPAALLDCYAVWPEAQNLPLRLRLAIDALAAELPKSIAL
ncbi:LysR family transcriptional regulator [Telmatospirillum siberiense]|uniref:LysR family transcriptional regulator n=1 Tax=Telmatospirillum siberiense TaxID=382514 RepID=A0A2N3PUG5_9PROT|nr:LysR family transcriptional regulator [Telmatospirillum siberiense]PKU24042.1 LysR family transcriptional regulator [Telmatospirillum siberiense]